MDFNGNHYEWMDECEGNSYEWMDECGANNYEWMDECIGYHYGLDWLHMKTYISLQAKQECF
jgi:hypothetical protein